MNVHGAPYKVITDPEIIRKKNEMRNAIKTEYIKNLSNPLRNAKMEGGTMFDEGIQRFMSMKATSNEFFRPTTKNSVLGILTIIVPYCALTYFIKKERDRRENLLRTGQVAYKDRGYKFA
ncbi:NADH dehydrogenase [ubiquinone] 1 beta subcomplex subunit 4 [Adelges cooleyi]|uniref:NADH dehydrogenase [ubiquinone] 1 beta subcomplex subunit 4 n=1 Tax=Adelges cooleyi TaxID=133065 RepID=UPI00217FCC62|nr:NADH dehydrogenase [ubiquinone] 1 beta subcomplex subunit 4 [Adelges cooleyi]